MICLGIEGTAHSFSAGVVDSGGRVRAAESSVYLPPEGIHPRKAADHHAGNAGSVVRRALEKAGVKEKQLGLVAFSQGPGLPPCLRTAASAARAVAVKNRLPVIGVNHCIAHIEIGRLTTGAKDPITVYVSGGNSQIIGLAGGCYRVFGETLDIGIGNAIDKFARHLELGNPGGPAIDRAAEGGSYIELPYSVKGMDFAFSGLLTAAIHKAGTGTPVKDVCLSFRHNAYAMVAEVTERALSHTGKSEVLLTGGVAASKTLQEMLDTMCRERGAVFRVVDRKYAGDNGAMIAWQGLLEHRAGRRQKLSQTTVLPKWRTDEVEVVW